MKIDEEPLSEKEIKGVEKASRDIKEGRIFSHEQVKEKPGLT